MATLITASLMRGITNNLCSLPDWLLVFSTVGFVFAFARKHAMQEHSRAIILGLVAGIIGASVLPATPLAAPGVVTTHALPNVHQGIFDLITAIDENPVRFEGRRLSVSGDFNAGTSERPATVSRKVMTCCAADALAVGFDVLPSQPPIFVDGTEVMVTGTLHMRLVDGEIRYALTHASVQKITARRKD